MIILKTPRQGYELRLLHRTLWSLFQWALPVWTDTTGQRHAVVTCVFRSQAETSAIYQAAGLPAPAASVHGMVSKPMEPFSGVRGIDLSARDADAGLDAGQEYGHWPLIDRAKLDAFAVAVNATWRYQPGEEHQVSLVHAVAGIHVHLQVARGETTTRREVFA